MAHGSSFYSGVLESKKAIADWPDKTTTLAIGPCASKPERVPAPCGVTTSGGLHKKKIVFCYHAGPVSLFPAWSPWGIPSIQ
jgi:hypothetical protein